MNQEDRNLAQLPVGWVWAKLADIANVDNGFAFKSCDYQKEGVPITRISNIKNGHVDLLNDVVYVKKEMVRKCSSFQVRNGDILIALSGATTGKFGSYDGSKVSLLNQRVGRIVSNNSYISQKYLLLYLAIVQNLILKNAYGAAQPNISTRELGEINIPIASLSEQIRIIAKVEELFSFFDAGIESLRKVQAQLIRYRQTILNSALEGKLTEDWRKSHKEYVESAGQLLLEISKNRRDQWEEDQLFRIKQSGRNPRNEQWKTKYRNPIEPETNGLPKLPAGWIWVTLDQITWLVRDGLHFSPEYSEEGIPFITGGNVRSSGVDFENSRRISEKLHLQLSKRVKPELGDILYTKGGTTGIARVNTYSREFSIWVHVALLKLVKPMDPFYVQHALNSPFCYAQSQRFTHGVGNQDLGLTRMIKIVLSLPPFAEQKEVVSIVDRLQSIADQTEKIIEENIRNAEQLRQSILKTAFNGKLVSQDPNDEPAENLLERIKTQQIQKKSNFDNQVEFSCHVK